MRAAEGLEGTEGEGREVAAIDLTNEQIAEIESKEHTIAITVMGHEYIGLLMGADVDGTYATPASRTGP